MLWCQAHKNVNSSFLLEGLQKLQGRQHSSASGLADMHGQSHILTCPVSSVKACGPTAHHTEAQRLVAGLVAEASAPQWAFRDEASAVDTALLVLA